MLNAPMPTITITYSPAHGPQPVGIYLGGKLLTYAQAVEFAASRGTDLFALADTLAPAHDQILRGVAWEGSEEELRAELSRTTTTEDEEQNIPSHQA